MIEMTQALRKAIRVIVQVAKPQKIILFGSRVQRNNPSQSDYDLLVLKRDLKKTRALAQKIYLNFKNIGAPIDVIVADLKTYEELKEDPYLIYREAAQHGRVIYEKV
jgi:predicted nucleotidyltransferase